MRVVVGNDETLGMLCRYMAEKTDVVFDPASVQGFAVLDDNNSFIAAVIVSNVRSHNGRPVDCEISCATESSVAWRPNVCRAIFGYVFGQLGCVRCTSITKKSNVKSRAFLEALNFRLEGNVRRGYDGEKDALIYGLLAEECEFYSEGKADG